MTERDFDHNLDAWLDSGPTVAPARVVEAAQLEARLTRQSRWVPWGPAGRSPNMNAFAKLAMAAAAAVVIAIIAISLYPRGEQRIGGPQATPSTSPAATATAEPTSSPGAAFPPAGELEVGRHHITLGEVPVSFEIPTTGWVSNGEFGIDKGQMDTAESAGFIFWTQSAPDNVYADPCARIPLDPAPGSSAAELAEAVANVPGSELVSGPSPAFVGGFPAQHVAISIREDIACDANEFYLWYDSRTDLGRYASQVGSTIHTWIIDVDGALVWIDAETYASSGPDALREIRQIIDSMHLQG
jgi:hypothetical protein